MANANKTPTKKEVDAVEKEAKTTESSILDTGFLIAKLVKNQLEVIKEIERPWHKLSEAEQDRIIQQCDYNIKHSIREAVQFLDASISKVVIKAGVDKVVFKDGIQLTLKVPAHEENRHELADAQGATVSIVIMNEGDALTSEGLPKAEPDQNILDLGNQEALSDQDGTNEDFEENLKKDIEKAKTRSKGKKAIDGTGR